jgi:biotin operon repressor
MRMSYLSKVEMSFDAFQAGEVAEGQLLMTQAERDRLVALKKAKKKLITQKQAAEELGITERHVRRLLRELKRRGDQVVAHGLRGLRSNRKLRADTEREAVAILSQPVYRGFAPTLAAEHNPVRPSTKALYLWPRYGALFVPTAIL